MSRLSGGITLIVIGAILTFAFQADIPGLGEYALGLILMLGGALLVVLHFMTLDRGRTTHTIVEDRDVVEEPVVERRVRRRFY